MSEWITTGQLVDRLKVGEIAELEESARIPTNYGPSYSHVIKSSEDGDIRWCREDGTVPSASPLTMYGHVLTWKWRILPLYVTFDEAMKALAINNRNTTLHINNKEYAFHSDEPVIDTLSYYRGEGIEELKWSDLYRGKWTIEEDE